MNAMIGSIAGVLALGLAMEAASAQPTGETYAVVVSPETRADPAWRAVVDALVDKHHGQVIEGRLGDAAVLAQLRARHPRFTCFVATPEEAGRDFVVAVHQLTRTLDDDPFTDTLWGIVTGYTADNALAIARETDPLTVRDVLSGTEVALDRCERGRWFCELVQNKTVAKEGKDGEAVIGSAPSDTTAAIVEALNAGPDAFITSGHATERDWQIGFRYENGYFRCEDGRIFGQDTSGNKHFVASPNPKVYLPIGNCLMGHIPDRDCMALAFMNSAGVRQMLGYVEPTWYGYAGWGVLDYFIEQPGRYSLTEAFFANQHALVHRLETHFPGAGSDGKRTMTEAAKSAGLTPIDARGLAFDRDMVAFYGDPAWSARMAPGPLNWDQSLEIEGDAITLRIVPKRGAGSFDPVNENGSQRGHRPFVAFLPDRIDPASVEVVQGADLAPVVTDDFILVPHPGPCDTERDYTVKITARRPPDR